MRFLFVYQDHAVALRNLVQELLVSDVHIIVVRKNELHPRDEDLALLKQHSQADAAACEVNRKYRKHVEPFVTFTLVPTKFRIGDRQLREWLRPPNTFSQTLVTSRRVHTSVSRSTAATRSPDRPSSGRRT